MMQQRRIRLEAEAHAGTVRFLSGLHVRLEAGKTTSWVTVTRTGTFHDPRYGEFEIRREMLLAMVKNFDARVMGQDVFIDVAHRPDNGAAGKILKLAVEGDRLRALVEWTPYGIEAIQGRGYAYLSAEYNENWQDNEQRAQHGPVLLGAALTVRPVIKRLDPIQLSEPDGGKVPTLVHPELQSTLSQEIQTMWKQLMEQLKAALAAIVALSEPVRAQLVEAFETAVKPVTEEAAAKALMEAFVASGKKLAEQIESGAKDIKLSIEVPALQTGMTAEQVKQLMADEAKRRADAAKTLAETREARVKLLRDTIGAAQGLTDEIKKELGDAVADLVTEAMTEEHVKKLGETQIASGHRLEAAKQLSGMGFQWPQGSLRISVDSGNDVKALQEEVDKRLYGRMPKYRRYALSDGEPIAANKEIVEASMALYDAQHGRRLHQEYKAWKQLASGDSLVSDVAIPAIFERTVIREALFQLVGLGLVDVGTAAFSAVVQLPYSFRDTGAAGIAAVRKYEGQGISRAAVKQALEEARPIPQKLAFEVSDELRHLVGNGQIDFDIVSENARNAARIIGEDTEQLIFDELLNASDQFLAVAVVDEAVATANGTNKIFVLDNFPVVRPKKVFDLQGAQVGSTLWPITVKLAGVAKSEWDGSGNQPADTYWVMNHNLGEITFVNQAGVPVAPANLTAVVASYSYTSNVFKWDSDLGTLEIGKKYNDFLFRFGLRKVVVEDRSYTPNVAVMSGTLRTQIEQAEQFGANFRRQGTDLMADGNLGRIKDVPSFRSFAPGLAIGDQRMVIHERGTTRFRMLRPWSLGELENQKDANGRFTGKKEAYGDQFIVVHTPVQLKGAFTSMVVYSAAARVDRVS